MDDQKKDHPDWKRPPQKGTTPTNNYKPTDEVEKTNCTN